MSSTGYNALPQDAAEAKTTLLSGRRYRVLAICSHPVQYHAPILRRMASRPDLDLHVAYCTLSGAEVGYDPEFGTTIKWDIPMLDGYQWTHIPNKGSGRESFFGLRNPGLWKLIREGKFDAIVCYVGYVRSTFWISLVAAKTSGVAFLFGTDSTTLESRGGRTWKRAVKRMLWPLLFRCADQVMVPSSGTRELMRKLGLPDDRVTLTPYVVDNDWWLAKSAGIDRDAVRRSWGASPGDAVILFCAKLQPWKRPFDLLRAFIEAKLPNAILVFAGEGSLRPELEAEVAILGVGSRVRFLGFVNQSQLPAVYKSADLMVLPSEYEPFGVVVNEAMCCDCAVITSDQVGAARDLVIPGRTGFVYPRGDIAALARILKEAVRDPLRLESLRQAAFVAIQSWSPTQNIAATIEAVQIAVARTQGPGRDDKLLSRASETRSSPSAHNQQ
jgi:glycosyltransferase involved in cell wall biosynthesis